MKYTKTRPLPAAKASKPIKTRVSSSSSGDTLCQLFEAKVRAAIDQRYIACSVAVSRTGRRLSLRGFTMYPQTDSFVRKIAATVFGEVPLDVDMRVLSEDYPMQFYEVVVPAAGFHKRAAIGTRKDLLTQGLYGTVIRGYFTSKGYLFAQNVDGYVGYVPLQGVKQVDKERYLRWKNGPCALLRQPLQLNGVLAPPAARLVLDGNEVIIHGEKRLKPPKHAYQKTNPKDARFVTLLRERAKVFECTPYLWGGKTESGIDCSGLVQTLLLQANVLVPRDANMQAAVGEIVGYLPDRRDLLPGDLVFFMNDNAHIFHVGVYVGNDMFLHSSGAKNVVYSSFEPGGQNYIPRYHGKFVFGRRMRPLC